jgi:histidinol phosphatase-like enzyme
MKIMEKDAPQYVPAQTRVLILPVINQSGEKDRKQRADQIAAGQKEVEKQFRSRGFQISEHAVVEKTLADLKIDLTDEENHNRSTLYKIGEAQNADIVAFVVITNVDQKRVQRPFGDDDHQLESRANIKIWVLDVKHQQPLLSAFRQEAQAKNILFASFDSGARLIRKAVEGAVRDSLKETLAPYPVVQKQ